MTAIMFIKKIVAPILIIFLFAQSSLLWAESAIALTPEEQAWIESHPPVKVGVEPWLPIIFQDEQGEMAGLAGDYLRLIAERSGLRYQIVGGTWDEILNGLRNKTIDLIPDTYFTEERATYGLYSKPYFLTREFIYVREDNAAIQSMDDLSKGRIAVPQGYGTIPRIRKHYPQATIVETKGILASISAVLNGDADAMLEAQMVVEHTIKANGIVGLRGFSQEVFPVLPLHLFSRIDQPLLHSILQKGLDTISDKERRAIEQRWLRLQAVIEEPSITDLTSEEKQWLGQHPVIRVHNEMDWPPFNFYERGAPRGFSIDYMNLLAEKLGIKVEYQTGPSWNEFLQLTRNKQLDVMLNIVKTQERQKYLLYTEPYVTTPNVIVSPRDAPISSISELNGRTVAFPKGFFYEEVLTRDYPQIKRLPVEDTLASLKVVALGKADAVLGEDPVLRYQISKNLLTNLLVTGEVDIGNTDLSNLRIGVRDDWPLFHSILSKAMAQVTPAEMNTIQQRWLSMVVTSVTSDVEPALESPLSVLDILVSIVIFVVIMLTALALLRRYGISDRIFGRRNLSVLVTVMVMVFLAVVIFVALSALERMDRQLREDQGEMLVTVNNSVKQAFDLWEEIRVDETHHFADDNRVLPLVEQLLQLPRGAETLLQSDALGRFRELYNYHNDENGALGFFIIAPDDTTLASSRDSNVGSRNLIVEQRPDLMARVFAGKSLFIPPVFSDVALKDATGRIISEAATMFFAVPVHDLTGNVIAALTLRFDPVSNFTRVTRTGRLGESGETYAFDSNARLITESRFGEQLSAITEYYRDGTKLLSLRIRDPGGNLLDEYRPENSRSEWPLTFAAEQALTGRSGVNVDGYRNYRGVPVLGAWSWSEELGIGLATEIDLSEALESYHNMRVLVLGALGAITFVALLLNAISIWIGERARSRLTVLVDERTEELRKVVQAVEQNPLSVIITDIDGNIEHVNPAFTQITGYEADEVIGKNPRLLQSGETSQEQYEKLWQTILAGNTWHDEIHNRMKSGELYWESISIAPVTNAAGEVTHFVAMASDISEAKEIELALQEARESNELILDSAGEGIFGIDTSGHVTFCNRAATEMLGYRVEELLGIAMHEAVHHSHADGTPYAPEECPMRAAYQDGETHEIDDEVLWRKDGSNFPVEYTAVPMRKNDQLVGSVVMFKDITERKLAEDEIAAREQQFRNLVETIPGTVYQCLIDEHWTMQFISDEILHLSGYPASDFIHNEVRSFASLIHPDDVQHVDEVVVEAVANHHAYTLEYRVIDRRGETHFVYEQGKAIYDVDGRAESLVGTVIDISERKQSEEAVKAAERRSSLLLESASDGIFGVDKEGILTFINPAGTKLLGFDAEELKGKRIHPLIHHSYNDGSPYPVEKCPMYQAFTTGEHSYTDDEVLWCKDGSSVEVEYSSMPIREDGKLTGAVIVFRDISERRAIENEIKHINFMNDQALGLTRAGYWHVPLDGTGYYNSSRRAVEIFGDIPNDGYRYHVMDEWFANVEAGDLEASKHTLQNFQDAIDGKVPAYDSIYAYKRPVDGAVIWIHAYGTVSRDEEGNATNMYGVTQDITEYVHAQQEMHAAKEAAEEASMELQEKFDELARFRRMAVGRELKMIELKKEVNEYLQEKGQTAKYKIVSTKQGEDDHSKGEEKLAGHR
ncbi:MAG: PAS domain S-box protein [Gammaproteobacteria bacterium]|nr:PAS domain S-box protein [Gammaproteobacteria bacterium]